MSKSTIKIKFQVREDISPEEMEALIKQAEKVEINGMVLDLQSSVVLGIENANGKIYS